MGMVEMDIADRARSWRCDRPRRTEGDSVKYQRDAAYLGTDEEELAE